MIKQIAKGFVLGLLSNLTGVYLYVYFLLPMPFMEALRYARAQEQLGEIIASGALLNLGLFFFLLQSDFKFAKKPSQPYQARGVLLATMIAVAIVFYLKMEGFS